MLLVPRRTRLTILALAGLTMAQSSAAIEQKAIFRVVATQCAVAPGLLRIQTGFTVRGRPGIVTALHGVAGCGRISAYDAETGSTKYPTLNIAQVDVERDIAILSIPGMPVHGLSVRSHDVQAREQVWVTGFPQGSPSRSEMGLFVGDPVHTTLQGFVPNEYRHVLEQRRSPGLHTDIIYLTGNLQPGHSGGPVYDAQDRVVGVAIGGLGEGTLGIGWAVPWNSIRPVPKSQAPLLNAVALKNPALVFAYGSQPAVPTTPTVRMSGNACIQQSSTYDLDDGRWKPSNVDADLFLGARDNVERYLYAWSGQIANLGPVDYGRITPEYLSRVTYSNRPLNASRDSRNELPPGTVLAVRTNQDRYAKVRILGGSRGDFPRLEWQTFARPGEGRSPVKYDSAPCSMEESMACGSYARPGDAIHHFVVRGKHAKGMTIELYHGFDPGHGRVFIGGYILDRNGSSLSRGFFPTAASPQGRTVLNLTYDRPTPGESGYLFVWMYEAYRGEAFICRRYNYVAHWG